MPVFVVGTRRSGVFLDDDTVERKFIIGDIVVKIGASIVRTMDAFIIVSVRYENLDHHGSFFPRL